VNNYRDAATWQKQIAALTETFVNGIIGIIQSTPVYELAGLNPTAVGPAVGGSTRTNNRTANTPKADINDLAVNVVTYVKNNPNVGAEQIRQALDIAKNVWLKTLTLAMKNGLKKTGEKRATKYYVGVKTAQVKNTPKRKPAKAITKSAIKAVKVTRKRTPRAAVQPEALNGSGNIQPVPELVESI
jgi:hypothetical protein